MISRVQRLSYLCSPQLLHMRSIFALFCIFVSHSMVNAQQAPENGVDLLWSDSFKSSRNNVISKMIGSDAQFFYVLRDEQGRNGRFVLDVFDRTTMKRVKESVVFVPNIPDHVVQLDDILILDQKLFLIVTAFDADGLTVRAYATMLGQDGKPTEIPILLAEAGSRKRGSKPFGYQLSKDKKLLLIYPGNPSERRVAERYSYRVVDAKLETVWQKDLDLPYNTDLLEVGDYRLDSRGHLYMLSGVASSTKDIGRNERQQGDQRYTMISYNPEVNKIKEFDIAVDGKWVIATSFDLDDSDNPVVGGFYSNDRYFSISGTFFLRINGESKQIEATGMKDFEPAFIAQFLRSRRADKNTELNSFYFDHFIVRPNGGAVFVAEQYYVEQRWRTDIATGRQEILYYYHYNDLIVIDAAPDGTINWTARVPKEQVSVNDRGPYSSYALASDGNNIHILFNDNPENVALLSEDPQAHPKAMNSLKRSSATLVTIDEQGNRTRKNLFKSRDSDVILRPKTSLSPTPGELFLYGRHRKSYRFGRLQFK